jgi:hypothetical protein
MTEKRKYHRIAYTVGGTLMCRDAAFNCKVENLSMNGALVFVRNDGAPVIRVGDSCLLRLYHEVEGRFITITAVVAHRAFSFVGLAFSDCDNDSAASLESIMQRDQQNAADVYDDATYRLLYRDTELLSV